VAEYIRHGDASAAIVDILKNYTPELVPMGVTVSSSLNGWSPDKRWIMVSRQGGLMHWPYKIDRPRIDIRTYAPEEDVAFDLASIAEASIFRARGIYSGMGVRLQHVIEEVGPTEVWDKHEESPAYFFSLRLTTTPDLISMPTAS
jgi:hypothetical protein